MNKICATKTVEVPLTPFSVKESGKKTTAVKLLAIRGLPKIALGNHEIRTSVGTCPFEEAAGVGVGQWYIEVVSDRRPPTQIDNESTMGNRTGVYLLKRRPDAQPAIGISITPLSSVKKITRYH